MATNITVFKVFRTVAHAAQLWYLYGSEHGESREAYIFRKSVEDLQMYFPFLDDAAAEELVGQVHQSIYISVNYHGDIPLDHVLYTEERSDG